jgi:hypothetical protein
MVWQTAAAREVTETPSGSPNGLGRGHAKTTRRTVTKGLFQRDALDALGNLGPNQPGVEEGRDRPHALEPRNICPRCQAFVKLASSGRTGSGQARYCCPARKTITIKRVKTATVTRTVVLQRNITLRGQAYYGESPLAIRTVYFACC